MGESFLFSDRMSSSSRQVTTFFVSALLLIIRVTSQSRFSLSKVIPAKPNIPSARSEHLAVVINSGDGPLLIVHGGRDQNGPKSDTWTYLVSKNQWTLLAPKVLPGTDRPPPVYGAVGGYRFVEGKPSPFLYVAFGMSTGGRINREMWVMEFETFKWRQVQVNGDIPEARHGAIGSLERFNRPDGSVEPALIISHGHGEKGLLSDTYKCSFHPTDPYRATWRLLRSSVGQYSTLQPHPMWTQASTFTANRDLVVFGGCYASQNTGGKCPHSDVWLLYYKQENSNRHDPDSLLNESARFMEGLHSAQWQKAPDGPGPRVGATMCQGLSTFNGAYESYLSTAVLYGGSHDAENVSTSAFLLSNQIDGSELSIFSTQARAWKRERVEFVGPLEERNAVLSPKNGMSMNIVKMHDSVWSTTDEYYLLFGGQDRTKLFSSSLLRLSFDAFMQSDPPEPLGGYISRPFVHGVIMFLSWGVLMMGGAGLLRYRDSDERSQRSKKVHVSCEMLALSLTWIGLAVVRHGRQPANPSFSHARLGTALVALATTQPFTASLTALMGRLLLISNGEVQPWKRRVLFRSIRVLLAAVHSILGTLIVFLGWINITLGLFLLMSPTILWIHWVVLFVILVVVLVIVELGRDRRIATQRDLSTSTSSDTVNHGSTPEIFLRTGVSNKAKTLKGTKAQR